MSQSKLPSTLKIGISRGFLEIKQFMRQRESVVFTLLFPVLLLLIFGSVFKDEIAPGVTFSQYFVAGMIASGLVIGILGGINHFQSDAPHLIDFQSEIDPFPVLSTYLGMFLAGAMFLSIGILVSSLVKDQMVSALIAMGLSLLFLVAGFWRPEQDGGLFYRTLYFFSVPLHFERSFTRGTK